MTWEQLEQLKHKLQDMEADFMRLQRQFGQMKFEVESAILKKED